MDINTFSKLSYGVYIVASGNKERQNAFIATTVMQVTSKPAKIVVACNKNNFTTSLIRESKVFSVSVLKQDYKPTTMGTFGFRSGKDFNKFEHCKEFIFENMQTPIVIEDCLAWFDCQLTDEMDVGTHILFVGKVLDAQIIAENEIPLTYSYYHEMKKGVTPKNAPSYIMK
ncbi:MAG: flavin reductase family protein [Dysgonamonadaceae bacterium]|jgi:flavin reductase (DIM6/NTAB) family NADH-FMN oxidoreductase RutF|nr:flavin reductase family protein [Dysgonamonadaceae bacterium]